MFLKPIKKRMEEIEEFVKDTTHELNTPLTALMMSTSRLKSKEQYDTKVVKNISISTKQLYDIYSSLSFLSFDTKSEEAKMLINNLLSNAIKYSKPKTTINVRTTRNSFIIKDEGIGICSDKLDKIFQRFVRANSYAGGFGVGLNIVDSIVKEYGYKLKIKSQLGKGTEITIHFV